MFQVDRVDWLDDDQLFRLMQGLLVDARRHGEESMGNHDHEQTLALFEDELDDSMLEYMDDPEILAKWPQG
ncbi:hypothetical protein Msub_20991 [Marinobacter subterrani]|uniref:Uncharacterized protein n=1 Tax=Marinobacter subterrani TaxID=1658765 RepID=A0A0J7LY02_9GAMM|nr:hypothetical protein Msub_20991 [Marinobacter subterrani]